MPYNTEIPDDLPDYRGANVSFPPPPQRPPIHWQIAAIALAAIIVCSLLALLVFLLLGHTSPQSSGIHAGVTTIATRKTPTSPPLTAIATNDPSSTPIVSGATPGAGAPPGTSSGSSPVAASPTMPPTVTPAVTPTIIDDTQWSYTGAWGVRDPAICDGSCTISRTQGSTAQLAFTGRQISVIGIHCPRCGIVGITVSGINSSVDTYRSQRQDSAIYTSPVLPYGTYTLVATVTGTANPLATNIAIGIDYALIFA